MKKLLLFLCLACCVAFAQVNTVNGKVTYTSTVPSGSCSQNNQAEFIVPTGALWSCQNGTWTQIGGSGTGVSSVSGTANQVDVATGTTTPVISLDPAIILPGSLTVPTGSSILVSGSGTIAATTAGNMSTSGTAWQVWGENSGASSQGWQTPPISSFASPTASATFTQPSGNTTTFNGTAPGSSAGAGTAGTTDFAVTQAAGGATTGSATTAGAGASGTLNGGGAGGSGAGGTNAVGGAGGSFTLSAGAGGASSGSAVNSNGGNIILSPGAAGTGGGGTAGVAGTVVFPLGSVSSPAFQATGSAANTGFYWSSTTAPCTLSAGAVVDCFPSGGIIIGNAKNYEFSQTASGTGAAGPSIGVVGSSTTEWLNTSTPIILPQCKIAAPVTLSTTTTICTWTLPNAATTFSYQCQGTYSTSAAAITLLLGTQFAQAPSAGANNAIIWSAASVQTFGTATNTGTTAVPTMTGAAVSSGTNIPWQASGTFTSSATSGTFVIYGTASTATDVTIATGSSCNLF